MYTTNRPSRNASSRGRRRPFSSGASVTRRRGTHNARLRHTGRPTSSGRNTNRGGRNMPSFDPSQFINTNPVEVAAEIYEPKHTFDMFGFDTRLVNTVAKSGMSAPSPIQDQIIPEILQGRDVIGLAETGTGKTAAFLLPLIEKTIQNPRRQALILAPTRELAIQIEAELQKLSAGLRMYSVTCVGGTNIRPQIKSLRRPNHFIIGTPGRVLDLIERGDLKTKYITSVVLDEADRMLDMGFIKDMRTILSTVPKERETLFFSATMSEEAKKLVNEFLNDPVTIAVKKKDVSNSIEQDVVPYEQSTKFETLCELLKQKEFSRVIVFGSMKHSVEKLARQLSQSGITAESIHGNKSHGQRQRALQRFKGNSVRVLVATDVAARGIHVENISHVINYDLPNTFEDYVHRIGRTGRAEKRGKALTFVSKRAV